jgi:hypothetical protein
MVLVSPAIIALAVIGGIMIAALAIFGLVTLIDGI